MDEYGLEDRHTAMEHTDPESDRVMTAVTASRHRVYLACHDRAGVRGKDCDFRVGTDSPAGTACRYLADARGQVHSIYGKIFCC